MQVSPVSDLCIVDYTEVSKCFSLKSNQLIDDISQATASTVLQTVGSVQTSFFEAGNKDDTIGKQLPVISWSQHTSSYKFIISSFPSLQGFLGN